MTPPALLDRVYELRKICDQIDQIWESAGRTLESFPDIVEAKTRNLDLTPFGELDQLISLLSVEEIAQYQQLSSFSDLYIKLFDNGYFWIEILNWWRSDINVHDHDFSGMQFQLAGESLNVQYSFHPNINAEGVSFGDFEVASVTRWLPKGRSRVEAGRKAPHNVCHLGCPTVSLLIRTHPRVSYGPQWNYFSPGVAASYEVADVTFRKRVKALRLLAGGTQPDSFERAFREFMGQAKLDQILFVLMKMIDLMFDPTRVGLLNELLESGKPHIEGVVSAVAAHRAAEIVKAFRWSDCLSSGQRQALALVGSCFDFEVAAEVAAKLQLPSGTGTLQEMAYGAASELDLPSARRLRASLDVFSLTSDVTTG